jgi:ATP-dependent Zn protease
MMAMTRRMGRPVTPPIVALLVIVAVALLIGGSALIYGWINAPPSSTVGYSQFLADVQAGRVSEVVQIGTTLEVSGAHGAYRVNAPTVLTDVYSDVDQAATAGHAAVPRFSAQPAPDNSWVGLVLSALLPFAVVLIVFVFALLLVGRPGQRDRLRSLTHRLRELDDAHRAGLITDDERARQRSRILEEA